MLARREGTLNEFDLLFALLAINYVTACSPILFPVLLVFFHLFENNTALSSFRHRGNTLGS